MINLLWKQILLKIVSIVTKEAGEVIDSLHTENKILRSKIDGHVKLTDYDRMLLVKYGMPIKDRLYEFISIVKPDTLLAWNRKMKKDKWTYYNSPKSPGRPVPTNNSVRLYFSMISYFCFPTITLSNLIYF